MAEEGHHDFQLNGKELVFLFMAATVVAVVVFLCGVMVGRGVRSPVRDEAAVISSGDSERDPTIAQETAPAVTPAAAGAGTPAAPEDILTYHQRLNQDDPTTETLAPSSEPQPESAGRPAEPASSATSAPSKGAGAKAARAVVASKQSDPAVNSAEAAPAGGTEPAGPGYVVQVAATAARADADAIARRLSRRGYPVFVTVPAGSQRMFRVRVGKYKDRREAESVASRLEQQEQFKPWITR